MSARSYGSPAAFKQALEQRLRSDGIADLVRRRQLLVFDRFLARVDAAFGDAAILKGGLVLELRLARARTTKDVDLRLAVDAGEALERLRDAAHRDLDDFMTFEIAPDGHHPVIDGAGVRHAGLRFRATCRLAGKLYGQPFGVDVGFGDPLLGPPDVVEGQDVLGFAGIPPPRVRLYPIESHIAEKLHAYTMPRPRLNSRVKDLPDIALLASVGAVDAERVSAAITSVFAYRATHAPPSAMPGPPEAWATPYSLIARSDGLAWRSLEDVYDAARRFLDPALAGLRGRTWEPGAWRWIEPPREREHDSS